MKNTVFLDGQDRVVQVLVGSLDQQAQAVFLHDYGVLYGAVSLIEVERDVAVWIGGSYTDGQFLPPEPATEPQPEPLPEPEPEPEI